MVRILFKILICVALMAPFTGCAGTQHRSSTGEYVDDSVITTKVKAAMVEDPMLKAYQINVKTYKGRVQLSGFVDSAQSVSKAGEVARKISGVQDVQNDLLVK